MLHPSGIQSWGEHLGRRADDSWRDFVGLEGHKIEVYEELRLSLDLFAPSWQRVVSSIKDVRVALAEAQRLLSLLTTQEHAIGDYAKSGYVWLIERYSERACRQLDHGPALGEGEKKSRKKELEDLEKRLAAEKKKLRRSENKRQEEFEEQKRQGRSGHDVVFAEPFACLVRQMQVKVVVLTTCRGGTRGRSRWGGLAAALLRAGVPVVVAMQYAISVEAAREFSFGSYDSLARGESIDEAIGHGRAHLMAQAGDEVEGKSFDDFGIPVIYSRMTRTDDLRIREIP